MFLFDSLGELTPLVVYRFDHTSALIDVKSLLLMTVFVSENHQFLVGILPNDLCESVKRHDHRARTGSTSEILTNRSIMAQSGSIRFENDAHHVVVYLWEFLFPCLIILYNFFFFFFL